MAAPTNVLQSEESAVHTWPLANIRESRLAAKLVAYNNVMALRRAEP